MTLDISITAADLLLNEPKLHRDVLSAFADFLHIDVANGDATEDTVATYRREVAAWVDWCHQKGVNPTFATRTHVETYREELKTRGLSVSTRSRKLSIIRRFYDAAVKYELLKVNPAANVKGGKDLTPAEEKIKALTEGALATFIHRIPDDTLSGKRDSAIVGLMAIHGLRRIEVTRLNHNSLQSKNDAPCLEVHGKGNKVRTVYLREDTYQALRNYIQAKSEKGIATEGALFVGHGNNARGARLSRRAMNRIVDHYLNETSLKEAGVSCHALRHTFGTLSVSGGAELVQVQAAMGHQDPATTALYVKALDRARKNPANFIGVRMKKSKETKMLEEA